MPAEAAYKRDNDYRGALGFLGTARHRRAHRHRLRRAAPGQVSATPGAGPLAGRRTHLGYLKKASSVRLVLSGRPTAPSLALYTDSTWADNFATSTSTGGTALFLHG